MKLFWVEDRYWNKSQFLWWVIPSSNTFYVALHDFASDFTIWSHYKIAGTLWWSYTELSKILWTNKWMFVPYYRVRNSDFNTYYCDNVDIYNSTWFITVWWAYNSREEAWNFFMSFITSSTYTSVLAWSRLMYL
jgi:hypothetical protein